MSEVHDNLHHISQLELAYLERTEANALSLRRQELARPVGQLVAIPEQPLELRLVSGFVLASLWYTDRQDGMKGRRSVTLAEAIAETNIPGVSDHPLTRYLTAKSTKAHGAAIDAESDKVMRNAIHEGLYARAILEGDVIAAVIMGFDLYSSSVRDKRMAAVRNVGETQGVDVKANWLGKAKTALQASGSTIASTSRKGSIPQRIGLGAIVASHVPSWLAVLKMRFDISRAQRAKDS